MNSVSLYVRQELSGSADRMFHPHMTSLFFAEVLEKPVKTIGINPHSIFSSKKGKCASQTVATLVNVIS